MTTNITTQMKEIFRKIKLAVLEFAYSTLTEENMDKLEKKYSNNLADLDRIKQIRLDKIKREDMIEELMEEHDYLEEEAEEMVDATLGSKDNGRKTKNNTSWR